VGFSSQGSGLHIVIGTGPAGCATARALVAQGLSVRMVSRSGKRHALVPASVPVVAADAADPASLRQAAQGASVLYQCVNVPYQHWAACLPSIQRGIIRAAQDLLRALLADMVMEAHGSGRIQAPSAGPLTSTVPVSPMRP